MKSYLWYGCNSFRLGYGTEGTHADQCWHWECTVTCRVPTVTWTPGIPVASGNNRGSTVLFTRPCCHAHRYINLWIFWIRCDPQDLKSHGSSCENICLRERRRFSLSSYFAQWGSISYLCQRNFRQFHSTSGISSTRSFHPSRHNDDL